jgi:predicted PurR-regulated permease PerM
MTSVRGWVIGVAIVGAAFILWNVLAGALTALLLLFTAVLFAAGMRPVVDRMGKRMPYGAAVGLAFAIVIILTVVIGIVLVQPVGAELVRLVQSLPDYVNSLQHQLASAQRYFENDQTARQLAAALSGSAGGVASSIGLRVLSGTAFIATAIGDLVLILLLAIGWMLSSGELEQFVLSLMPAGMRSNWHDCFAEIEGRLSAYVQGVVINALAVGIPIGASLAFLGVPYALLLGFIAAIFQGIPMVGAVISGPIILAVVLAASGWAKMLIVLLIFTIIQTIDQNVLSPIIFGQRVRLSFLLIILSTIIGGTLLGIAGAFLAVPAAAVLQVLVVRILAPAVRPK